MGMRDHVANINVSVEGLDLDTFIAYRDGGAPVVLGDLVAEEVVRRLRDEHRDDWTSLARTFREVREAVIREHLTPLVQETIAGEVRKTNAFGEPVGQPVTLRELIMAEVSKLLTAPVTNSGYRSGETFIQKIIREAVQAEFSNIVNEQVKAARQQVADQIGAMVADGIVKHLKKP
jgi:hypothetical protein